MYLEILIFVALYSLTAFDINIMPSLTTAYASLWFSQGEFDAAQYISTIISVCLVSAAVYIINRLIFGKKDIILNVNSIAASLNISLWLCLSYHCRLRQESAKTIFSA